MRKLIHRSRFFVALLAMLALAGAASAEKLIFHGSHSLLFSNLGKIVVSATGTGIATLNGSAGLGHLNTLQLTTRFASINSVIPVTDPIVTAGFIVEVRLTNVRINPGTFPDGQGGVFAPISGALQNTSLILTQNTLPSAGSVRICLFVPGCTGATLDQTLTQTVNGTAFTGNGVGGVLTIGAFGPIRISVLGAPWTVKTVSMSNRTDNGGITLFVANGFAHGPMSLTSSTALTSGVIQLVTANQTTTTGVPGNSDKSGNVGRLTLHFIPEPGILLLLGSGALGMVLLGSRRLKR